MTQHTAELRVRAVPQHGMLSLADFVVQGKASLATNACISTVTEHCYWYTAYTNACISTADVMSHVICHHSSADVPSWVVAEQGICGPRWKVPNSVPLLQSHASQNV